MSNRPVVYYVSGHGLGHASRAVQVMQVLPPTQRIIVKSMAPPEFFRRESGRTDLEVVPARFDVGAVQQSNREINWQATLDQAKALDAQWQVLAEKEADYLMQVRASAVVCDVPPIPLVAANKADIPGCLVANFTWVDIYSKQCASSSDWDALVGSYQEQYGAASLSLITPLSFQMPYLPNRVSIPLIARKGKSVRRALERELGGSCGCRIVLLYLGDWGDSALDWEAVFRSTPEVTYIALTQMPEPVVRLDPAVWSFPDLVASVDAVLAKPGYGTAGECMANGTPLVYYPRPEFAEYAVLQKGLTEWGGAVRLTARAFNTGAWGRGLEKAFELCPRTVEATGAKEASRAIRKLVKSN